MKKLILAACAAIMLTACQTAEKGPPFVPEGGSTYAPDNKPTVVTSKNIPEAKAASKAIFTRPTLAFKVVSESSNRLLFSKVLPANVNDNNILKDRTKGAPVTVVELTFQPDNGKTRVTGDNWMLLNPKGADKDKFNLLATPDGRRLQNKLNELR